MPADDETLTYAKLRATFHTMQAEIAAIELPMFLSDSWPIYKILKEGGRLVELDGKTYAVPAEFFKLKLPEPSFRP